MRAANPTWRLVWGFPVKGVICNVCVLGELDGENLCFGYCGHVCDVSCRHHAKKQKTNPKLKIIILVKFDLVPTENRLDACGACCGFYLVFFLMHNLTGNY